MKRSSLWIVVGLLVLIALPASAAQVVWQIQRPNSLDVGMFSDLGVVAVGPDDIVYIADSYNGIYILSADGDFLNQLQVSEVKSVAGLAVASDQTLWVADDIQNSLIQLTPDGRVLKMIGGAGSGAGQFGDLSPSDIAIARTGELYVFDTQLDTNGNPFGRIQVFNAAGNYQREFITDPNQNGIRIYGEVAISASGEVYLNDFWGGVAAFDTQGNLLAENILSGNLTYAIVESLEVNPTGELLLAAKGTLYHLDAEGNVLSEFGTWQGESGAEFTAGEFYEVRGLGILENGDVILADTNYKYSQIVRVVVD